MPSFNPVSAVKLTVARYRFAFRKQSSTRPTSSECSCASMASSARSSDNQKLISWDAVPEVTSRDSFVTDWMALIQVFTWDWRVFKKELSFRRPAGIMEMVMRVCDSRAESTAFWMMGWIIRCVSGISTFCCKWKRDSSNSANFFFAFGIP